MITVKLLLITCLTFMFSLSGIAQQKYSEPYRPQFHFSPEKGWIGDPDGLVRYNNKYHLFWWGHAVSEDLVYWEEKAWPMPNSQFDFYSGSAVIDKSNTAGFKTGTSAPMIAIFTNHNATANVDGPALAYSNEFGTEYTYFNLYNSGSPLMTPSLGFRDPSVFWDANSNQWIMVIAKSDQSKVLFYRSLNLKTWQLINSFSSSIIKGWWECPDLFQLPVDGNSNNTKWVLIIGVNGKTQYFIGDFNSQTGFKVDRNYDTDLIADYGSDFYAARTFRDYDNVERRTVMIAWLGNWDYANSTPTSWGRGTESIPREIALKTFTDGIRLVQKQIPALQKLRSDSVIIGNRTFQDTQNLTEFIPKVNCYEIDAVFNITAGTNFGMNLCVERTNKVVLGYDATTSNIYLDRRNSGNVSFSNSFPNIVSAPLLPDKGQIKLHVYVDQSSIEVFANDGVNVISSLIFPEPSSKGIQFFSTNGHTTVESFKAYNLKSIWATSPTVINEVQIPVNNGIELYPNPLKAGQDLRLILTNNLINMSNLDVKIYTIQGKKITEEKNLALNGNSFRFPNNLIPGVYIVNVETKEFTETFKLIVQ